MSSHAPTPAVIPPSELSDDSRRITKRHGCAGLDAKILVQGMTYRVHLKDLSCTGLCGITDAPLSPDQTAFFMFERWDAVPGQIRWIRNTLIGVAFVEPLPFELITRMRRSLANKRRR